ncbi:MAG: hypothetical protein P4L84_26900 [Isosphaeraceae bacterium]|nr:hypothetical protein [Isosphaeraceae bacterium]
MLGENSSRTDIPHRNRRRNRMNQPALVSLDRPNVAARPISARLRTQLVYFASASPPAEAPPLGESEFWFAEADVARWLDDGVFHLVSPLDTANMTELELTEEQETLLGWLRAERVQHVKVIDPA